MPDCTNMVRLGQNLTVLPVLAVFQLSLFFVWHICRDADIFLCKFAFCSLLINFVVSLNIRPVCQKAYSASSSCRHTFSDNKIISLFTKYFNKFRFQSDCPIHTPTSEVGEQSGIADLLIPFVRLFSLGQHGVITALYKSKIWQHIFFLSLTGTAMTLTLKAETHNGQESPYLGILHLFHTWPLFCWSL